MTLTNANVAGVIPKSGTSVATPTVTPVPIEASANDNYTMQGYQYVTQFEHPVQQPKKTLPRKDVNAGIIADWLINFCQQHGDLVTNMRLQRLLYFAQAWYLALYDETLFPEKFEAWVTGPVQPGIFLKFNQFGHHAIEYSPQQRKLVNQIESHLYDLMTTYGTLNAFELELQSQRDLPWIEARTGLPLDSNDKPTISNKTMRSFYRKRLNGA